MFRRIGGIDMSHSHPINKEIDHLSLVQQVELLCDEKISYKSYDIKIKNESIKFKDTKLVFENKSLARHLYGCKQSICVILDLSYAVEHYYVNLDKKYKKKYDKVVHTYSTKYLEQHINGYTYQTSPFLIPGAQLTLDQFIELDRMFSLSDIFDIKYSDINQSKARFFVAIIGIQNTVPKSTKCSLCLSNSKCSGLCKR